MKNDKNKELTIIIIAIAFVTLTIVCFLIGRKNLNTCKNYDEIFHLKVGERFDYQNYFTEEDEYYVENNDIIEITESEVIAYAPGKSIIRVYNGSCVSRYEFIIEEELNKVTSIELSQYDITLNLNETYILKAFVYPFDAINQNLLWSSSDLSVVTVQNGELKALNTGTALVTVKTSDGKISKDCTINVVSTKLTNQIELDKTSVVLNAGSKMKITPIGLPEGIRDWDIVWNSDDLNIATISNGEIYGVKPGTTNIRISSRNGKYKTICQVTVEEKTAEITSISLDKKSLTLSNGSKTKLSVTVKPSNFKTEDLIWTSSNPSVATIKNGEITALKSGTTTITASSKNGNIKSSCNVTVSDKDIKVTSISLDKSSISINPNSKIKINATIKPSNATNKDINWLSSNSNVADVVNGEITAKKVGTATITAITKDGEFKAKVTVNVVDKKVTVTGISLSKEKVELELNEKYNLKATIKPSNATNQEIIWTSSNPNIVAVSNGELTALNIGAVTITAESKDGAYKATCTVNVLGSKISVTGVSLDKNTVTLTTNGTLKLTPTISPSNSTNQEVIWTSSNNSVVKVENGELKALKKGTAKITVTTRDGGYKAYCNVTVEDSIKIHFIHQSRSADAILLESNNHFALIDAGNSAQVDTNAIINYLDKLNVKKLDFFLLTHAHVDHIGSAAKVINKYDVSKVYTKKYLCLDSTCDETKQNRFNTYINAINNKNIPITYIYDLPEGHTFTFDKMTISLYNTGEVMKNKVGKNENYDSVYELVRINGIKTLLSSDADNVDYFKPFVEKIGKVDVLKVPHHGYYTCGLNKSLATSLGAKYLIVTNDQATLSSKNANCMPNFDANTPRYFVNEQRESVVVDYTSGTPKIYTY